MALTKKVSVMERRVGGGVRKRGKEGRRKRRDGSEGENKRESEFYGN